MTELPFHPLAEIVMTEREHLVRAIKEPPAVRSGDMNDHVIELIH